jgi:hypothetical protein
MKTVRGDRAVPGDLTSGTRDSYCRYPDGPTVHELLVITPDPCFDPGRADAGQVRLGKNVSSGAKAAVERTKGNCLLSGSPEPRTAFKADPSGTGSLVIFAEAQNERRRT